MTEIDLPNTPTTDFSAGADTLSGPEKTERLNRDALSEGWAGVGRVPRLRVTLKLGARTDLGRIRDNNEDKFDFYEPEDPAVLASKGSFYAVADGMGGHSAGQIACELALKTVVSSYYSEASSSVVEDGLRQAVADANALIYDTAQAIPDRQGMGTTLTAAIVARGCADPGTGRRQPGLPAARRKDPRSSPKTIPGSPSRFVWGL